MTHGHHGRIPRKEQVAAVLLRCVGIRDGLVDEHHVVQELKSLACLGFTEQGLGMVGTDQVAAVRPDDLAHSRFKIPGIDHIAELVDLAIAIGILGQGLCSSAQVIIGPVGLRVGHTGLVEHVLVIEDNDGLEITRQAEVTIRRLVGRQGIGDISRPAYPDSYRCRVADSAGRLAIGNP